MSVVDEIRPVWRNIEHRVGLLLPSSNSQIEPEYYAVMPPSVSVHFARLTLVEVSDAGFARQDDDIVAQARLLATANVEVVLYCITSASFFIGLDYDDQLKRRIETATGVPALIAARTVIDALRVLDARRIALATPFVPEGTARARHFLEANGFDIVAAKGLGYTDNYSIALVEPETVRGLVREVDTEAAEAILIPGGNMPCLSIVEEMEAELGKPIVTTNQAGLWALLRQLGTVDPVHGAGRLLKGHLTD
jgi:maleate isomerase